MQNKILYNYRKYDEKTRDLIIDMYLQPYGNIGLICKKLKTSAERVKAMLLDNGIKLKELVNLRKRKKYTLNEEYFNNPETWSNEHAYLFGWICSDGHVGKHEISIRLQERDIDILEKFKKAINFTGNLRYIKARKSSNFKNIDKNYISKPQFGLSIASHKMIESLRRLEIESNKTNSLTFPNWLREDLIPHFIKGFWEGDGCVTGEDNIYIGFAGNNKFLSILKDILEGKLDVTTFLFPMKESIDFSSLRICGRFQVIKFLNWIYQDNSIYLDRKYQKYINLVKQLKYNSNIQNKTKGEIKNCKVYNDL